MNALRRPAFAFAFGAEAMSCAAWCSEVARPGSPGSAASIAASSVTTTTTHADAPAPLVVPAGHGVAAVLPVPLAYVPAGAVVQVAEPAVLLNVPAGHSVAEVAPGPVA